MIIKKNSLSLACLLYFPLLPNTIIENDSVEVVAAVVIVVNRVFVCVSYSDDDAKEEG